MIHWTPAMNTGVRQIDLQHLELVDMINEMERAHTGGHSSIALDEILPRLSSYAIFHFGEEEVLLAQVAEGTAFAERHLIEHSGFVEEIQRLIANRGSQSDHDLAERLTRYLADWLVSHIAGVDRVLAHMLLGKTTPLASVGEIDT